MNFHFCLFYLDYICIETHLARGQSKNDKWNIVKKRAKNVNQKMHQDKRRVQQVKCSYGIFSHISLTDILSLRQPNSV